MSSLDKYVTVKEHETPPPEPTNKAGTLEEWLENNFRNEGTKAQYRVASLYFLQSVYGENEYKSIAQTDEGLDRYLEDKERNFLDDIKRMLRFLDSKGLAPQTINGVLSGVKVFFEEHEHEIPKKEWKHVRRLVPPNVTITQDKILTKEEFRRVLTYLPVNGRAIAFFLLTTGARIGETLKLKIDNLDLDADPPEATFRATTTKKGVGGRTVFMSYEARDAIKEWLAIKDSRLKTGGYGKYPEDIVFGSSNRGFQSMWNLALQKAGLGARDSETNIHIYHVHTLRKFFETNMSLAGVPKDIYEAWMGHTGYLGGAYKRYAKEELAKIYKEHMDVVTIYGGMPSDFKRKLETIEKQVKEKDAELRKVNEMLEKLGIPNDRPLEERLLEYFRITQTRPQSKSSEISMKQPEQPKEIEKPKAGECVRGIKTAQWDIACRNCRTMHRLDYVKCTAPQKPKIQMPKRW